MEDYYPNTFITGLSEHLSSLSDIYYNSYNISSFKKSSNLLDLECGNIESFTTDDSESFTTSLSDHVNSLTTGLSEQAKSLKKCIQIYYQKNQTVSSDKSKKLDKFFDLECGLNKISKDFIKQSPYSTSNDVLKKSCNLSDLEHGFNI
jgi:hypothetical protein